MLVLLVLLLLLIVGCVYGQQAMALVLVIWTLAQVQVQVKRTGMTRFWCCCCSCWLKLLDSNLGRSHLRLRGRLDLRLGLGQRHAAFRKLQLQLRELAVDKVGKRVEALARELLQLRERRDVLVVFRDVRQVRVHAQELVNVAVEPQVPHPGRERVRGMHVRRVRRRQLAVAVAMAIAITTTIIV